MESSALSDPTPSAPDDDDIEPVAICVTGVEGLDRPTAGGAICRALGQNDDRWRVTALGRGNLLNETWTALPAGSIFHAQEDRADSAAFLRQVARGHRRSRFRALICGSDADVLLAAGLRSELSRHQIRCLLPEAGVASVVNRISQIDRLEDAGAKAPFSIAAARPGEAGRLAERIGYPLVVRGAIGGSFLVHQRRQAEAAARSLLSDNADGVLLQACLPGDAFSISGVAKDGKVLARTIVRATSRDAQGDMHSGTVIDDADLGASCDRLIKALAWRGGFTIDVLKPARGKDHLVCAFSGVLATWVPLSGWAGCNLAEILVRATIGAPTASLAKTLRPGVGFVRTVDEVVVPVGDLQTVLRQPRNGAAGARVGRIPVSIRQAPASRSRWPGSAVRVAVTGINTFDMINPGLGVGRALRGQAGIEKVIGLGYGALEAGAFQPSIFHSAHRLPPPGQTDAEDFFAALRNIHRKDPFDVVIPSLDGDVPKFIETAGRLEELGVRALLPSTEAFDRREKTALFGDAMLRDWGAFQIPDSSVVERRRDALVAAGRTGFPAAIKGEFSLCERCQTLADIDAGWWRLKALGNEKMIVQPFIDGEVFAIAAVCDRQGNAVAMTAIKKLAACSKGSTWGAAHAPLPELEDAFAVFLKHIGWVGPVEGEFIRARFDDTFYLFEVNPRSTGWVAYTASLGDSHPLHVVAACFDRKPAVAPRSDPCVFIRGASEARLPPAALAAFATRGTIQHA